MITARKFVLMSNDASLFYERFPIPLLSRLANSLEANSIVFLREIEFISFQ